MAKRYLNKNVYEAAIERIEYIFNEFDNVLVAFSGGKDSGVCLNLCYEYAKEHNRLDKLSMYHLDYEAQYQMTTDYVDETFKKLNNIKRYWYCMPIKAQCSVNMDGGYWIPWEDCKKDIWVRNLPDYDYVIHEQIEPIWDYDYQDKIGQEHANKYGKTAVVIGIRANESLNRFRAVQQSDKVKKYDGKSWLNIKSDLVVNAYPIYDWETQDIWIANAKNNWAYNRLYDLYYQAGLSIEQMRVASPFNDCAASTLKLYKVIDPNNWGKMIGRVNGVNFAGLYGGTTAMGWKSVVLPKGHTWKSYCEFLLSTLDEPTRKHYEEKLNTSIKFWREKGGALSDETIEELTGNYEIGEPNNYSRKKTVKFEEYPDDLNVTNFREVPTYKRMCICIMKNDYYCKYMGFAQTKNEREKRKKAIEKYGNL